MNNQLATREAFINPTALQQIEGLSNKLISSNALPAGIKNPAQLMMVLLKGYESGMDAMESIDSFYFVNGKLTIWGDATLRQLRRAGYAVKWLQVTDEIAEVEIFQGNKSLGKDSFTMVDAETAGLKGKNTWKTYPKDQLRWKALSRAIRFHCPEVLGGTYITEAIQDDLTNDPAPAGSEAPADLSIISLEQRDEILMLTEQSGGNEEQIRKWAMSRFSCELEKLTVNSYHLAIASLKAKIEKNKAPKPAEEEFVDTAQVIEAEFEDKVDVKEAPESPVAASEVPSGTTTPPVAEVVQEAPNLQPPAESAPVVEADPWDDAANNQVTT